MWEAITLSFRLGFNMTKKQKQRAANKRYYKRHKIQEASRKRIARYGVSLEEFNQKVLDQKGVCAICSEPPQPMKTRGGGVVKNLCVDHNHITKNVRGLLCHRCNRILGLVKEDPIILDRMITYLAMYYEPMDALK